MTHRLALLLAVPLASLAGPKDAAPANDQTFASLERAWSTAYHQHDLPKIERLLAAEFVGIDGRVVMSTRAEELAEARAPAPGAPSPAMEILEEEISDVRARVYGEIAVATALNTAKIRTREGQSTVRYRRSTVWVQRDGRWQCVHFHASRIL